MLSSDDLTSGITRVLVFIPVTLLGNDADPIVHWYFTSSPVAEQVNVAACNSFTVCGKGGIAKFKGLPVNKTNAKKMLIKLDTVANFKCQKSLAL